MYSRIVVPLDGSASAARALRPARAVAAASDAPVLALSCLPPHEPGDERRRVVEAQLDEAGIADATVMIVPAGGAVATAVAAVVEEEPGSLVVMASVGHPHAAPVVGSVAEELLHALSQPVLLVGPHAEVGGYELDGPLVVAVDGSKTSESAVALAGAWAVAFRLQPWVVTVVDPGAVPATIGTGVGAERPFESAYVHRVADRLSRAAEVEVEFEVLHRARPAAAIVDDARDRKASVICCSTHGQTGARRIALGSVAMAVVHHAPCPVLVNRPPRFAR